MEEPSVLDYVMSRLTPWKGKRVATTAGESAVLTPVEPALTQEEQPEPIPALVSPAAGMPDRAPWRVLFALACAIGGQALLEPAFRMVEFGLILYGLAALFMIWALVHHRDLIQPIPDTQVIRAGADLREMRMAVCGLVIVLGCLLFANVSPILVIAGWVVWFLALAYLLYSREYRLGIGSLLLILAFMTFVNNRFTAFNVITWISGIALIVSALWIQPRSFVSILAQLHGFFKRPRWSLNLSRWTLLVLLVFVLIAFFRFYRLSQVPGEMFSDHAEKLLDVNDLLNGQTKIFFERNTGREFIQFYLTAAIIKLFGTGISFISLKLGTALAGFFTLPFIYKLGKEIGSRWVGLLALLLAGIAYWPNVISRIGLRFPLYPLFVAPTLFFLVRGLRTGNRNDFILCGLSLGLGLHGYSPVRILPFVVVAGVVLFMLHQKVNGRRIQAFWALMLVGVIAFAVFLPLFRYALENPQMFNLRALSRLTGDERPLPGPMLAIFFSNTWKALIMFFWNNGNIWVHSVIDRPALDVMSAALFFLGVILLVARYLRSRNWVDLFLLVSVPLLLLPSILSLAFPEENPSLNRTGGAIIPVFIIVAIALEAILRQIRASMRSRRGLYMATSVATVILLWSLGQNYDLVFRQFDQQFMAGAWNTSQIGQVIRGFADSVGTRDTAYVVPFPYWVDTRLVGINAGFPDKDYALWPEDFQNTVNDPHNKMFILKPEDQQDLNKLTSLYPQGVLTRYRASLEGKDFLIFLVPGLMRPRY